jgi:hypothetical protein
MFVDHFELRIKDGHATFTISITFGRGDVRHPINNGVVQPFLTTQGFQVISTNVLAANMSRDLSIFKPLAHLRFEKRSVPSAHFFGVYKQVFTAPLPVLVR